MPGPEWRRRVRYASAEPAWWGATRASISRRPPSSTACFPPSGWSPLCSTGRYPSCRPASASGWGWCARIADEPRVLLLDEPTSALDAAGRGACRGAHQVSDPCRPHRHSRQPRLRSRSSASPTPGCMLADAGRRPSSRARRHELRAALRHRSGAGGVAACRQRGHLAGLRLRLGASFAVAAVRMAVQLAAVGFVLKFIFAQTSPLWTLLIASSWCWSPATSWCSARNAASAAGWPTVSATRRCCWSAAWPRSTPWPWCCTMPWYAPRYIAAHPRHGARQHADELQPGAADADRGRRARAGGDRGAHRARRHALRGVRHVLRRALRTAITPLLNIMSVAGIVSLPGMMTGQILAGADPAEAAKYQIMIMFVLTGAARPRRLRRRLRRRAAAYRRPPPPAPRPAGAVRLAPSEVLSPGDRATTSYRPNLARATRRPTGTPNPSWQFESAAKASR